MVNGEVPDDSGTGAPEVEVTQAMIEAGFSVLSYRYDPDAPCKDRREVVRDMYLAMIEAKRADNVG
jgi:hypothetical protein